MAEPCGNPAEPYLTAKFEFVIPDKDLMRF